MKLKAEEEPTEADEATEAGDAAQAPVFEDAPRGGRISPVFAILALIAVICFAALLAVQWQEFTSYYKPGAEGKYPAFIPGQ